MRFPWYNKTNIDCLPRSTLKNYVHQLCNVTLGSSAMGQHYTTSGHNFSVLTSAPVNICIMLPAAAVDMWSWLAQCFLLECVSQSMSRLLSQVSFSLLSASLQHSGEWSHTPSTHIPHSVVLKIQNHVFFSSEYSCSSLYSANYYLFTDTQLRSYSKNVCKSKNSSIQTLNKIFNTAFIKTSSNTKKHACDIKL